MAIKRFQEKIPQENVATPMRQCDVTQRAEESYHLFTYFNNLVGLLSLR